MKLKLTLYTRILISTTIILVVLVSLIVLMIQRIEFQTIFRETRNRGILTAQYIANLNLRPLVLWDEDTLRRNVENQADNKLVYIVFYDRDGKPRAANELARELKDIYCCSHLQPDSRPDSSMIQTRDIRIGSRRQSILEIELPIFVTGAPGRWASIKVGNSLEDMRIQVRKTRRVLIFLGLAGLLLGLLGSALLAKQITRPLGELVEGTVRISNGDFSHRIPVVSGDELGDLAQRFNAMTGQLLHARERMEIANRKLIQAEKLASIGKLSATIAHEIRNPLTSVKLNIQRIAESEHLDDTEREHLGISQEGISQIEKFIKELLNFTRAPELVKDRFSIQQILEESLKMLKDSLHQKKVLVETAFPPNLPTVHVDGDKMRQVFLNVLRNALEAVAEGGRIGISLELGPENNPRKFVVKIHDDGEGIPEKDWENIFEPFYTTKASGFGLGLANARKILELHNGTIRVMKKKGKGSQFVVTIPLEEGK